jgi:hypothetical protein
MLALLEMVQSHRITAVIYTAAKLDVAEALRGGPQSAAALAPLLGADPNALHRLLVTLTTLGLCTIDPSAKFSLTELGRQLDEQAPGSIKDWVIFEGELLARSWAGLVESVRSGKTAAQLQGLENSFDLMAQTPRNVPIFNAAMANLTRLVVPNIVAACDFSRSRVVMDIGCGSGELLAAVLSRRGNLRGIGFDLLRCAEAASRHMRKAGLADRFEFVPGDFFDEVPARADTFLLKSVIHDWSDERCGVILANCREALPGEGRLILIERVMPDCPACDPRHRSHALSDLNMLRGPGGRERSQEQYEALLDQSGFRLRRLVPAGLFSVMEANL